MGSRGDAPGLDRASSDRLMLQPRDEAEHDPQRDLGIGGIDVLGGMMAEAVPAADEEHDDAAEPRP